MNRITNLLIILLSLYVIIVLLLSFFEVISNKYLTASAYLVSATIIAIGWYYTRKEKDESSNHDSL